MKRIIPLLLAFGVLSVSTAHAGDIGFVEDFALAKDRAEALKKLIPGTEDYYYYNCLNYLNTEQFDKAEALTKPWFERFNQTPRLTEIQTRHALLTYEKNPQKSLDYFKTHLGLTFNHQKLIQGGSPSLPTALDPKVISRDVLRAFSFAHWPQSVDNFEDVALDWLAPQEIGWERLRNLLSRLQRPDIANLPQLIVADLNHAYSGGFGSFAIHRQLTLAQLDELAKLKPDLLNQVNYVQTYLTKLHPNDDEDWRRNPAQTRAYLDRLIAFVRRLSPVHNSLKAHVLYHRLVLDQAAGTFDKALFIEYLKLPRRQGYMARAMLEAVASQQTPADLNADYTPGTMLPIVGGDEALVRAYLKHFLLDAASPAEFEPYINDIYLKHLFAEVKIENGLGEPEQWASMLSPELYRQLKDRIDIDFAATNKTAFRAEEAVALDLYIKNVPTLMVKVFEVNTTNFYRTQKHEVDTAINLDGLIANSEKTYTYTDSAFRRMSRKFEFPQLAKPGVYVIDFIGAGKSSRALIRKGRLRPLVSSSTAGNKLRIVDDANNLVQGASVWLGGQEYTADENGAIFIPFSTNPGRQPIVITKGDFSSLDYLEHQAENYALIAGIHVDRESLLTQRMASVIVRPSLLLNGHPISIKLLEEVKLRITATDQDGIATSTEVPNFKLFEDREAVHEFRVPPRLMSLNIVLVAQVKSLSLSKSIDLAAGQAFGLNGIASTDKIEDLHLASFGGVYVLELRGRSGEPRGDRPVRLQLKTREFRQPVDALLKTDAAGRITLGALENITSVTTFAPDGTTHSWSLPQDRHTYRQVIHAQAGAALSLPYLGTAKEPGRDEFALFEMRGTTIYADRFDALTLKDGALDLKGLQPGDYQLWLKKTGEIIRIGIVDGPVRAGFVLGQRRQLELPGLNPLRIDNIAVEADTVTIKLGAVSPTARVHIFATRYRPAFSAFADLAKVRDAELGGVYPTFAESLYLSGRNIGDEYRYVLDRRNQAKFPGNMNERPALLLNPWVLRSTETGEQLAQAGEAYKKVLKEQPAQSIPAPAKPPAVGFGDMGGRGAGGLPGGDFADLNFLYDPSSVLLNLVPDKDGLVKVPRKALGAHSMIRIVAVDPLTTTAKSISLPEQNAQFVDLRLRNGLDPKGHFTQKKQVNVLVKGQPFTLADAASSRFEVYDSLPRVYSLYSTLSHDPKLAEFSFILTWPKLKKEEKQTLYSKYACHELNFFLAKKDPDFFKTVVQPYLANKKDKTFLDHWLLSDDLTAYMHPWEHARLNSVERILLAQRLAGEPARTSRHLSDLLRLLPPNADRNQMLFETALKNSELSLGDSIKLQVDRLSEKEKLGLGYKPDSALFDGAQALGGLKAPESAAGGRGAGKAGASLSKTQEAEQKALSDLAKSIESRNGRSEKDSKDKASKDAPAEGKGDDKEQLWAYREDDRAKRRAPASLFRRVEPTQELAENNYYKLPIAQQLAGLVGVSGFWVDYAKHDGKTPFLSSHLADASRNFTEMMFALSLLDLPFEAGKSDLVFDGGKMTYTPAGTVLAFHEEVRPVAAPDGKTQILVNENFYRAGDRYRDENGERFDKFVTQEFVIHTVYGCQVVVTNPTPSRQRLSVLIQIPVGAIAVANGQPTKSVLLDLEPYRTQIVDYQFYFPKSGQFPHFPVQVAKAETLVAAAAPFTFNVVDKPTKLDTESWDYVSQNGTDEQVVAFLNRENVNALDLEKIAFRMKDKAFFETVITLLEQRHVYNATLWSYAVLHNITPTAREYFAHLDQVVAWCGGPIVSPLLVVDPVARYQYEHLEYKPLVNARAHSLGHVRQIVNGRFHEQYHEYLKLLTYHPKLTDNDELEVTYYLLLQDRVAEALESFAKVNVDKIATVMQYDYCAAYLDLYTEETQKARSIALKYVNHPVDRWRNTFTALISQLDEIDGKAPILVDKDNRDQEQARLAAKEANFEFTLDAKTIHLTWQNIETVRVNYYLMDVELLFSRNPFVQQSGGQFSMIRPNETKEFTLQPGQTKFDIALPENLVKKNVLVEITSNGKTKSLPYYANAMTVTLNDNYGQVQVMDATSGKALPKVYVKTYVRLADGTVKFHKDGYTDLRGKFDYASVSTPETSPIVKYGILVLSETQGALIREANPPQQ